MRKPFLIITLLIFSFLIIFTSCNKNPTENTGDVPEVITAEVSSIMRTSAECGGKIKSDGAAAVTSRGVCWSTGQTPTIADSLTTDGTGSGNFISSITGLLSNTTYYVRAYATSSAGTGYGSIVSFTTLRVVLGDPPKVTDIDGNLYSTVMIGSQIWMAENLQVTHYRNGDEIPYGFSLSLADRYANYENDINNGRIYGCLYNWLVVTDSRGLAPEGWHIPSKDEWIILIDYLGGTEVAGNKMKYEVWSEDSYFYNSDFYALSAGAWQINGFYGLGEQSNFWSSSESTTKYYAWYIHLFGDNPKAYINYSYQTFGCSVRCIKD